MKCYLKRAEGGRETYDQEVSCSFSVQELIRVGSLQGLVLVVLYPQNRLERDTPKFRQSSQLKHPGTHLLSKPLFKNREREEKKPVLTYANR